MPGDLAEKVNPYLRPLYDALDDMLDVDKAQGLIHRGHIEVAPLAFMRGRTLNDSFVILDEAQNTTSEQMRMFLTRLGYHSKAVVTGDVTQVDLPEGRASGLREARDLLDGVEGIAFCHFTEVDVVRHPLVQKIIVRYEARDRASARRERCDRVRAAAAERRRVAPHRATASRPARTARSRRWIASNSGSSATRASRATPITRPHALLVTAWRTPVSPNGRAQERLCVVFAPAAAVGPRARAPRAVRRPLRRRRRRCSSSSGARTTPGLGDAVNRGLGEPRRRRTPTHEDLYLADAPRVRAARGQGARRGARPVAPPLPLRARRALDIARAMTTVRDVDKLLGVILEKSRFVTGADAGSIYIVERARGRQRGHGPAVQARRRTRASPSTRASSRCRLSEPVDRRQRGARQDAAQHPRRLRPARRLHVPLRSELRPAHRIP